MQIIYADINSLKEYKNNPRKNDKAVEVVANSIKEFGFKVPIIVDKNNVIIAGHTRHKASKKLGLTQVPIIVANDLTEEQVKAFRLADNKVSELSEWDFNALSLELVNIDMDMSQFNFEIKNINQNDFGEDFSLPDSLNPSTRTITLSLSEEQYQICLEVIEHFKDKIENNFGNKNKTSNALFEVVYLWAKQNNLL